MLIEDLIIYTRQLIQDLIIEFVKDLLEKRMRNQSFPSVKGRLGLRCLLRGRGGALANSISV